jgi:DNA-binding HxlR family transcriptional regulator
METRTERLLRVLGNREAFAVVRALLIAEMTTSGLVDATKLSVQTLDRTLETLSQGSVVSRRTGTQGAWYIVHWPETFAVLDAVRRLSVAIAGTEEHLDREEAAAFMRLEEAGGAVAAARRGRRPGTGL